MNTKTTLKLTAHELTEWSRCAAAAYRAGRNGTGHSLSVAAATHAAGDSIAVDHFDALQAVYRRWLVGGFDASDV